ncbi:MAG TPA: peptidoglycan DD-metalloendopeptidase family protein [Burkholderiaceae bacterium]|nr:peptidoglycan DD-metalloendopeptidase family protein [Burkholderiaceae bacterium]
MLLTLLLTSSVGTLAQPAPKLTERSRQKQTVESERAELRQQLNALKRSIDQTESAHGQAADALAEAESAISKADRALHDLAQEQKLTQGRLERLTRQHTELAATVAAQQKRLAKLLRGQYAAGNEDRLKLLLSGDNPNRINRDLHYFGYVSQAQASLIEALRANLQAVEQNQAETRNARDELDEIAEEQQQQKTRLQTEKAHRATLLAQLAGTLAQQRKQAGGIARDEQRLGRLVDQLSRLIEEQKKAEAAAREKRRQEQLAQARAAEEKQRAAAAAGKNRAANPDAIDDDEPPARALAQNELTPEAGTQAGRAFAALRGHLRLPVAGDITAKFGGRRSDGSGSGWKGLFIRAAEGSPVKTVADGRVVFADWLRGFGNLLIVDHGSQYLTIYGNNQALLKRPGDQVKGGEIVARTGNTGGNEESGLYFEMRYQGRAFDPLGWVTTR